jgi:hypothetical protein
MDIGQEPLYRQIEKLLAGEIVLPDIQRDFVWAGPQIPRLLDSLNQEWPVGSVLLWNTNLDIPTKTAAVVQNLAVGAKPAILLDGQQRLTTLARVMAPDRAPSGEKRLDVRFNPETRQFNNANAISRKDPKWIPASEILRSEAQFRDLVKPLDLSPDQEDEWTDLLSGVAQRIRNYMLPVQTIHEDDYETVAEIFNRVNTGGRRLSKGDLVMGSLAARWHGGREVIESFEAELREIHWGINREVLLRIMSVLTRTSPNHIRLLDLKTEDEWKNGWYQTEGAVRHAVQFIRDDARIPAKSLLPTEYVVVLPAVLLHDRAGVLGPGDAGRLSEWIYLASAFGHYSGSLETTLASDITLLRRPDGDVLDMLMRAAQEPRTPGAMLTAEDIRGKTRRSPFLRLMELFAVQSGAQTWWSHRAITEDPLAKGLSIEVHHIFPRAWLKRNGLGTHPELDTLANFGFLSKYDNIKISDGDPSDYLVNATSEELSAQWVPDDPDLWRIERFDDFCAERRQLIADALNAMLGLSVAPAEEEPLEADESPEPEIGAWAEDEIVDDVEVV